MTASQEQAQTRPGLPKHPPTEHAETQQGRQGRERERAQRKTHPKIVFSDRGACCNLNDEGGKGAAAGDSADTA